jgi:hypothetical protein
MKRLAATISKELEAAKHCAVYNTELARVWPIDGMKRQRLVEQFAKEHGWTVGYYKDGFVAIFTKASPANPN